MSVATANFPSTPNVNTIVEVASRLPYTDFQQLLNRLNRLAVHLKPMEPAEREEELIHFIKNGFPPELKKQFMRLSWKLQEDTITDEEHAEFMLLTQKVEAYTAERLKCLIALAKLHNVSVDEIMKQLKLKPWRYVKTARTD